MDTHSRLFGRLLAALFRHRVQGINVLPVLRGPLKGKALPEQPALEQLSMLFGCYEPAVVSEALRCSATNGVVYDVGANIGFITLALAHNMKEGGKIYAFEPLPRNAAILRDLARVNFLEARVEVVPLAVGNKTGKQKFVMWLSPEMYLLESAIDGQDAGCCESIVVDGTTMDSFVFELKNPPPQVIKIDVEGAEALVLEGGKRTLATYSPHLIMEIHGPSNAEKVWQMLGSLNYVWVKLTKKGRAPITTKGELLSNFTKYAWTHHFLLSSRCPVKTGSIQDEANRLRPTNYETTTPEEETKALVETYGGLS